MLRCPSGNGQVFARARAKPAGPAGQRQGNTLVLTGVAAVATGTFALHSRPRLRGALSQELQVSATDNVAPVAGSPADPAVPTGVTAMWKGALEEPSALLEEPAGLPAPQTAQSMGTALRTAIARGEEMGTGRATLRAKVAEAAEAAIQQELAELHARIEDGQRRVRTRAAELGYAATWCQLASAALYGRPRRFGPSCPHWDGHTSLSLVALARKPAAA